MREATPIESESDNDYGFTDGEPDFIINYDIEYRMNPDDADEDAE